MPGERPLKILYIDGVGGFGGASRSLFEVLNAMPEGSAERYFVIQRGTILDFYGRIAKDVIAVRGLTRFDHTRAAHYRGLRWLVTLREFFHLPFTIFALLRAKRRWPTPDLIHVNEFTEIIPGLIARRLFGVPLIVHVRSLVEMQPRFFRTRWLHRKLRAKADAVIAIDEGVRATLPADLPVDVIHNSFTAEPMEQVDEAYLAQFDALRPSALKVGFVGNLLQSKGLAELAAAARIVKEAGADVQFVIVGGDSAPDRGLHRWLLKKAGLAQNQTADLRQNVVEWRLGKDFLFFGPTPDIQRAYPRFDVLAFPSHLDSPGRPVFEAAFYGVPSIVAVSDPQADTVIHGETAIAIPAPEPRLIADAVLGLASDRAMAKRMGENARALAERNFVPRNNAGKLLNLYRRLARPCAD